jgi:hypothetical protein
MRARQVSLALGLLQAFCAVIGECCEARKQIPTFTNVPQFWFVHATCDRAVGSEQVLVVLRNAVSNPKFYDERNRSASLFNTSSPHELLHHERRGWSGRLIQKSASRPALSSQLISHGSNSLNPVML